LFSGPHLSTRNAILAPCRTEIALIIFVIPSGARNLSEGCADEKKERFLAPLGMTKLRGNFSAACPAMKLSIEKVFFPVHEAMPDLSLLV